MAEGLLAGRTALVTGASSGLGRHFATVLARNGAKVAIAARRMENLEALAGEIGKAGGQALPISLDVADPTAIRAAVEKTEQDLGPIGILINNSGIAPSESALDVDEDAGQGGSIINIASVLSLRVQKGTAPYAVSKAGLLQMTKALALEWARFNIRVNAIAPGYFETDISRAFLQSEAGQRMAKAIPQRRFGEPEDLDGALLFLAGDSSKYVTGVLIPVDGGHNMVLA
jgi:NAD(P)-dependent dehydrogenase (short-subunit alcohol dehydrogenase family)